jgi:hypothetical protein
VIDFVDSFALLQPLKGEEVFMSRRVVGCHGGAT